MENTLTSQELQVTMTSEEIEELKEEGTTFYTSYSDAITYGIVNTLNEGDITADEGTDAADNYDIEAIADEAIITVHVEDSRTLYMIHDDFWKIVEKNEK